MYNPDTGEVQSLSPAAADLLARCDGSRSVAQVVEIFPREVRDDAQRALQEIAVAGLLDPGAH